MNETAARSIRAAIAVMLGRREALAELDLSADGFWGSFLAMAIALPALAFGWYAMALRSAAEPGAIAFDRLLAAFAATDFFAWVVPLALFGLISRPLGLSDRFIPYAVVTNWGSVPIIWLMLPGAIADLLLPAEHPASALLSFLLFGLAMAFTWRITEAAIDRGPWIASAVFAAMFLAGMSTLAAMRALTGV